MSIRSPWWFCCGWWSPWCVLDVALHNLHLHIDWVCDRHDRLITCD